MRIALVLLGIAAGVLGYGWWHAATHATFFLTLTDTAAKEKYGSLKGAQLAFHDEAGRVLARGKTDEKHGVAWISHPTAGYCGPDLPPAAYAPCFRAQAEWLPTWVPLVHGISIVAGRCRIERAPLRFSASRDSAWTWWIPLPHVGGTPYTNFNAYLQINGKTCTVVSHRG